jgi:AcrR family transcriptional regulator
MTYGVKTESKRPGRKAGRPRSEKARLAILKAAHDLLMEGGLPAVTMEGAAARAKVGKPTAYRHFGNRHELAMAALMQISEGEVPSALDSDPLHALKQQLFGIAALFESPTGRFVTSVLASGYGETEISKAFRSHFVQARREYGRALLQRAVDLGEIRPETDLNATVDQLYGAIFYRLLMGHGPVTKQFIATLFDQVMLGVWTAGTSR